MDAVIRLSRINESIQDIRENGYAPKMQELNEIAALRNLTRGFGQGTGGLVGGLVGGGVGAAGRFAQGAGEGLYGGARAGFGAFFPGRPGGAAPTTGGGAAPTPPTGGGAAPNTPSLGSRIGTGISNFVRDFRSSFNAGRAAPTTGGGAAPTTGGATTSPSPKAGGVLGAWRQFSQDHPAWASGLKAGALGFAIGGLPLGLATGVGYGLYKHFSMKARQGAQGGGTTPSPAPSPSPSPSPSPTPAPSPSPTPAPSPSPAPPESTAIVRANVPQVSAKRDDIIDAEYEVVPPRNQLPPGQQRALPAGGVKALPAGGVKALPAGAEEQRKNAMRSKVLGNIQASQTARQSSRFVANAPAGTQGKLFSSYSYDMSDRIIMINESLVRLSESGGFLSTLGNIGKAAMNVTGLGGMFGGGGGAGSSTPPGGGAGSGTPAPIDPSKMTEFERFQMQRMQGYDTAQEQARAKAEQMQKLQRAGQAFKQPLNKYGGAVSGAENLSGMDSLYFGKQVR